MKRKHLRFGHEIRNVGRGLQKALNTYVPPAYRKDGIPLPRGRK